MMFYKNIIINIKNIIEFTMGNLSPKYIHISYSTDSIYIYRKIVRSTKLCRVTGSMASIKKIQNKENILEICNMHSKKQTIVYCITIKQKHKKQKLIRIKRE